MKKKKMGIEGLITKGKLEELCKLTFDIDEEEHSSKHFWNLETIDIAEIQLDSFQHF